MSSGRYSPSGSRAPAAATTSASTPDSPAPSLAVSCSGESVRFAPACRWNRNGHVPHQKLSSNASWPSSIRYRLPRQAPVRSFSANRSGASGLPGRTGSPDAIMPAMPAIVPERYGRRRRSRAATPSNRSPTNPASPRQPFTGTSVPPRPNRDQRRHLRPSSAVPTSQCSQVARGAAIPQSTELRLTAAAGVAGPSRRR